MIRIVILVFLCAFPFSAGAITPQEWQSDLQQQIENLRSRLPNLALSAPVAVTAKGDQLEAIIPPATGSDAAGNLWRTPVLTLHTPAAAPVVQSLEVLPGGPIALMQKGVGRQIALQRLQLQLQDAKQLRLTLDQLQTMQNAAPVLSVGHAVITYKTKMNATLSLGQILDLLQQQIGNDNLLADADVSDIRFVNKNNTLNVQSLKAQAQIQPQPNGGLVTVRNAITAKGIAQSGVNFFSIFMPRDIDMVGTITALPKEVLKGTLASDEMQRAMAAAGTKITLDHFQSQTPTGVVLKGQGAVKPDLTTPSGLVGRVTIQMEKMQEALAQAQQDPGKAQGVLGLMLLQGLGRADQETTRFVLDLTPDGQTLLNGQDFSAVTKMFKGMGGGNPLGGGALPVTPVPAAPPVQQEL